MAAAVAAAPAGWREGEHKQSLWGRPAVTSAPARPCSGCCLQGLLHFAVLACCAL